MRRPVKPSKPNVPAAARLPIGAAITTKDGAFVPAPIAGASGAVVASGAVLYALPQLNESAAHADKKDAEESKTSGWGKKMKPPAMVLDEDVNGFKVSGKGKGGGGGGGKRKGRKVSWFSKYLH